MAIQTLELTSSNDRSSVIQASFDDITGAVVAFAATVVSGTSTVNLSQPLLPAVSVDVSTDQTVTLAAGYTMQQSSRGGWVFTGDYTEIWSP